MVNKYSAKRVEYTGGNDMGPKILLCIMND